MLGVSTVSNSDIMNITAGENLVAGNATTLGGLKARANSSTLVPAVGFVLASVTSGGIAQVISEGLITPTVDSALVPGAPVYLSAAVAGNVSSVPPSSTSQYIQQVGVARTTTTIMIQIEEIVLMSF
jgi:hypothetical protein